MKLKLIVVGRDRRDPLCMAAADYLDRVRRYYPIELVEVKEEPARGSTPVDRVKVVEAERIEKAIPQAPIVVALDERGKALTSVQVAHRIERWSMEGPTVCFVVGGPVGLDPAFLRRAQERWRLSSMTLPHRFARLLIAEQLYRACTIVRREPYHK